MSHEFRPVVGEGASNRIEDSWTELVLNQSSMIPSVDSIGGELNRGQGAAEGKVQEVVSAGSLFLEPSTACSDRGYSRRFLRDSVELTRQRLGVEEGVDTSLFTEADFCELFYGIQPLLPGKAKDESLERVIKSLLKSEFIAKDKEAIRRLPAEDRSYNIFNLIMNYNALKKERFALLYEALSQISSESKKAELREIVQAVEAEYNL